MIERQLDTMRARLARIAVRTARVLFVQPRRRQASRAGTTKTAHSMRKRKNKSRLAKQIEFLFFRYDASFGITSCVAVRADMARTRPSLGIVG